MFYRNEAGEDSRACLVLGYAPDIWKPALLTRSRPGRAFGKQPLHVDAQVHCAGMKGSIGKDGSRHAHEVPGWRCPALNSQTAIAFPASASAIARELQELFLVN